MPFTSNQLRLYRLTCNISLGNPNTGAMFSLSHAEYLCVPCTYWKCDYYLLSPWRRVLLEKLTGFQLVKKFPEFYGTRTALTSFRYLSLSWASPIQSTYPHPTSWRSLLILYTHLRLGLPSGLFPSGFPTKNLYAPLSSPYAPHAQPISFMNNVTLRENHAAELCLWLQGVSPEKKAVFLWPPCYFQMTKIILAPTKEPDFCRIFWRWLIQLDAVVCHCSWHCPCSEIYWSYTTFWEESV